jgi:hypothetical protein
MIIVPDKEPVEFIYADGGARKEAELFQISEMNISDELNE